LRCVKVLSGNYTVLLVMSTLQHLENHEDTPVQPPFIC